MTFLSIVSAIIFNYITTSQSCVFRPFVATTYNTATEEETILEAT